MGKHVTGRRFVFKYPVEFVTLPGYSAHRGQTVRVVRPLKPAEYDNQGDRMYEIRAEDGWVGVAWRSELEAVKV